MLSTTTDARRELVLPEVLVRLSETDFDLDNGGALPNMLERPRDIGGLLALSEEESRSSFSEDFLVDLERFRSVSLDFFSSFETDISSGFRSLDDFFSPLRGAAPQAPQEDPSRTTRGRSFLEDFGSGGGVGGEATVAVGVTGSSFLTLKPAV